MAPGGVEWRDEEGVEDMEGGEGVVGIGERKQHGFNGVLLIEFGTRARKVRQGEAKGEKN